MVHSDHVPQPWHSMLFFWAILAFSIFINTVASKTLAHFEGIILVLHVLGFFAGSIPLVYLAPHGDISLFTTLANSGGWPTQGLSFMVGLPASVFSLVEIKNTSTVVPRATLITVILNGILGFAMVIAYLFCLGNLDHVLNSQKTLGYPFLYVFQTRTGSTPGAAVMGLIIAILGVCSTVGVLASSSRMLWVANNVFACAYLLLLWFWSFWPPLAPVAPETLNFSVLTFGATALFSVGWYFLQGKKKYKEPIVEVKL